MAFPDRGSFDFDAKQFAFYQGRWQFGSLFFSSCMYLLSDYLGYLAWASVFLTSAMVACLMYPIDKRIFSD